MCGSLDVGQLERHDRASPLAVGCTRRTAVGTRHRVDESQPESRSAAGAGLVAASEAVERVREKCGRKAVPLVGDAQLHPAVSPLGLEPDRSTAMTLGVVDEVPERLFEPEAIADDRLTVRCCNVDLRSEASRHGLEEIVNRNRLSPKGKAPLVGPGEHQQVLGEPARAGRFPPLRPSRRAASKLLRRARVAQRELELSAQQRQRRAQLVTRVGDEAPFACMGAVSSRPSISFRVSPSRPISSSAGGTGSLGLPGLGLPIAAAASRRIDSTGRSACGGEAVARERGEEQARAGR